jgi:hypothetical protein
MGTPPITGCRYTVVDRRNGRQNPLANPARYVSALRRRANSRCSAAATAGYRSQAGQTLCAGSSPRLVDQERTVEWPGCHFPVIHTSKPVASGWPETPEGSPSPFNRPSSLPWSDATPRYSAIAPDFWSPICGWHSDNTGRLLIVVNALVQGTDDGTVLRDKAKANGNTVASM